LILSAALVAVAVNGQVLAPVAASAISDYQRSQPEYKAANGYWRIVSFPKKYQLNAIHAIVLNTGKVLIMAGSGNDKQEFAAGHFKSVVWDPDTGREKQIPTPKDMFCAGHAQLPDGTWALPPSDRNRRMKGLADGVTTDLAILRHLYDEAQQMPSSQAIELLWQGLELVEGPPFDADGYDWAHHGTQDVAEASSLIERSAAQLVELALNVDDVERARGAITQGLRGLPGDEVLYRLRMRVEHHAGNLAGVSTAYDELVRYLADLDAEPSSTPVDLWRSLLRPVQA
jgi:hypothetical protein